ncbi:MAG: type II toxin-antitoxin system Phd/YefM family antitoxin [Bryobacteraceae bacterium]|nr:type II toxin-antitoxin system Phd/YefM family antitoxin [Bryobacteraceae bacterium]
MNKTRRPKPKAGAAERRAAPQEWQLQEAKARFSEVFRLARERGPQRVTKHGREAVMVIPAEEYARITTPQRGPGGIVQFFAASPLRNAGVELSRVRDYGRAIDL